MHQYNKELPSPRGKLGITDNHNYWRNEAKRARQRLNLGWWAHYYLQCFTWLNIPAATLVILVRLENLSIGSAALVYCLLLCSAVPLAYIFAKRKFFTEVDAFISLDARLDLNNSLSEASSGATPWPEAKTSPLPLPSWDLSKLLRSSLNGIAVVLVFSFIPLGQQAEEGETILAVAAEPETWQATEKLLDKLEHEEIIDREYLKKMRRKLSELRSQPESQWYEHSTMEAGSHLRDSLKGDVRRLADRVEELSELHAKAYQGSDYPFQEKPGKFYDSYLDLLREMERENLPVDKDWLKNQGAEGESRPRGNSSGGNNRRSLDEQEQQLRKHLNDNESGSESEKGGSNPGHPGENPGQNNPDTGTPNSETPNSETPGNSNQQNGAEGATPQNGQEGGSNQSAGGPINEGGGPGDNLLGDEKGKIEGDERAADVSSFLEQEEENSSFAGQRAQAPTESSTEAGSHSAQATNDLSEDTDKGRWKNELSEDEKNILKEFYR
ncbi:MAG: hypothetical protein PHC51_08780 [bacterium]|nr:hypothetical protein [bacterium]